MDFVFTRTTGVPLRDQLVAQLELKILSGAFAPGERLPSVRSLARRLRLHANTVAAAYQDLAATGRVRARRGSGVYVCGGAPGDLEAARGLDEMIRLALAAAFRKGFSGRAIRAAVERWLAAAPPDRLVVLDRSREMAELLAHEVRQVLGVRAAWAALDELAADPTLVSGAVVLALPYHTETVRRAAPAARVETLTLELSRDDRALLAALPAGSIVLIVSHAPTLPPYASKLVSSLRGAELLVEAHPLAGRGAWRRLVSAADLVFADALSLAAVRRARPRRLRELRVLSPAALEALRPNLAFARDFAVAPAAPRARESR